MAKSVSLTLVAVALLGGGCSRHPTWTYRGEFHEAIAQADRAVFRDDGFDYYGRASKAKTLFEITEPSEIRQFAERLEFKKGQVLTVCACAGYPRIDWYRGKEHIALASIQHGRAVRWKGFQGDAHLTPKSSQWLVKWLAEHGVDEKKMK